MSSKRIIIRAAAACRIGRKGRGGLEPLPPPRALFLFRGVTYRAVVPGEHDPPSGVDVGRAKPARFQSHGERCAVVTRVVASSLASLPSDKKKAGGGATKASPRPLTTHPAALPPSPSFTLSRAPSTAAVLRFAAVFSLFTKRPAGRCRHCSQRGCGDRGEIAVSAAGANAKPRARPPPWRLPLAAAVEIATWEIVFLTKSQNAKIAKERREKKRIKQQRRRHEGSEGERAAIVIRFGAQTQSKTRWCSV